MSQFTRGQRVVVRATGSIVTIHGHPAKDRVTAGYGPDGMNRTVQYYAHELETIGAAMHHHWNALARLATESDDLPLRDAVFSMAQYVESAARAVDAREESRAVGASLDRSDAHYRANLRTVATS